MDNVSSTNTANCWLTSSKLHGYAGTAAINFVSFSIAMYLMMLPYHRFIKGVFFTLLFTFSSSFSAEAQHTSELDQRIEETDSLFFPFGEKLPLTFRISNEMDPKDILKAVRTHDTDENYLKRTCSQYYYESLNDSIGTRRGITFYDEEGNLVSAISYQWDEPKNEWIKTSQTNYTYHDTCYSRSTYNWDTLNNEWIGSEKSEFFYDDQGFRTSSINSIWDTLNNEWIGFRKQVYFNDENGNDTLNMAYKWGNKWELNYKVESQFDDNGKMITEDLYYWNKALDEWEIYTKKEQKYDDSGNMTLSLSYYWNDKKTSFDVHDKREYEYDEQGNLILLTIYGWHVYPMTGEEKLEKRSKEEYSYDGEGNVILKKSYQWDHDKHEWIVQRIEEYEYADSGDLLFKISKGLIQGTSEWHLFKEEYQKDNKGNDITIFYDWDSLGNTWIRSYMGQDTNHSNTDCELPYTARASYTWDIPGSIWIPSYKTFCDCGASEYITVGITENSEHNIIIYPNPSESYIQLSGLDKIVSLHIYNLQGKLVEKKQVFNEKFSLSKLHLGVYILMLSDSNEIIFKQRIIKQ